MERYTYNTSGVDQGAEKKILRKSIELVDELDVNVITFYVHTFDSTDWIERMLGEGATQLLRDGHEQDGIVFNLETHRTFDDHGDDCILVALGQNSDTLFELECVHKIQAIVALPWVQDECYEWASSLDAYDLASEETQGSFDLSCVVEKALEQLTQAINITSGITNPHDERRAKTYIRALNKYDYELNVSAIKAYLVENNWTKNGMNTMADLISTVNEGGYFQGGERTGLHHHRNRWQEECDEN